MYFADNPLWSFQLLRIIGEAHYGGGNFGEIYRVASRIRSGNEEDWYREWRTLAKEVEALGDQSATHGHPASARDAYLRACNYYRVAEFFLSHDDQRKLATFMASASCFQKAGQLFDPPIQDVEVPYEGATLPGYLLLPKGRDRQRIPALIRIGGLDSTAEELYFAGGAAAIERNIACLILDAPGHGAALRLRKIPTRFDYEKPVAAAVDYLQGRPEVDPNRIALMGWSVGGYYAPRAAAFEHRLKACVAWGALFDGPSLLQQRPWDLWPASFRQQMQWVLGVNDGQEAQEKLQQFTLRGVIQEIRCPILITHGELDILVPVSEAHTMYEEAPEPKMLKVFTAQEGGAAHCQADNLALAHQFMFDWLEDQLG